MEIKIHNKTYDIDKKSWHNNSIRDRFLSKIEYTPYCWNWIGATRGNNKYGTLKITQHTTELAHRLSYAMFKHDIPEPLLVLHTCDNSKCVNPAHLFLGTQLENIQDRTIKGRTRNRYSIKQLGKATVQEGGKI